MTYFIADTHFNHANIIKYCQRPFETVEDMNKTMIDYWNTIVKPEDTVIHLGDFALCPKQMQIEFFNQLNGYKILVKGNHDGTKKYMLEVGFNEVVNYLHMDNLFIIHDPFHIQIGKREGIYTHQERYDECEYLLHGHVHEKIITHHYPKAINCCVEHHDYRPQTLENLIEWKNKTPI